MTNGLQALNQTKIAKLATWNETLIKRLKRILPKPGVHPGRRHALNSAMAAVGKRGVGWKVCPSGIPGHRPRWSQPDHVSQTFVSKQFSE